MDNKLDDAVFDGEQAAMLDWIETHWQTLAAVAWRGYVASGRGLVVLDGAWEGAVAVGYLTPADAAAAGAPFAPSMIQATQAYTPATEILFFVQQHAVGTLLGLRAAPPRLPPCLATQQNGAPPLVLAA